MTERTIRIGTRGSDLALWQARRAAEVLPLNTTITVIKTDGDRLKDIPLQGGSQTGFFTKAIEDALLRDEIDIAVHSLKDLPTKLTPGLALGACLKRGGLADLLLIKPDAFDPEHLLPVRDGSVAGAGSLRRRALTLLYGPHLRAEHLRGNVPTRIKKCSANQYDAIIIAKAGVERLQLDISPLIAFEMNPEIWLPAPGQGTVALEIRADDRELAERLQIVDHTPTRQAVNIERRLLERFEGGCHTAFGAYARAGADQWIVSLGMDRDEKGWGQFVVRGTPAQCLKPGPDDLDSFKPVPVDDREQLCRRWKPSY